MKEATVYTEIRNQPGRFAVWLQALRAFSFTASMIPVLLGAALAAGNADVRWELLPLVAAGVLLLHAGSNLVSDAADFKRGVDRPGAFGGSGVLVNGWLTAGQVLRAGLLLLTAGAVTGLLLVGIRGLPVLWLGIAGVVGGFGYGGRPFGFKYAALGDLIIFILFGLLISFGSYFVLTGVLEPRVLLASLPLAFLVTAIVQSNNLRDIANDADAGIRTLATVMGNSLSRGEYYLLVAGAYLVGAVLAVSGILPAWTFLLFLSLPLALRNLTTVKRSVQAGTAVIAGIDVETARLHLVFGVLMIAGILLELVL